MSELVWIHRFNRNELGLGSRGGFCLVPVDARKIFPELSELNDYKQQVNLYFKKELLANENYSKPASKSEYRLSFAGLKELVGDEGSTSEIKPNSIAYFYRFKDGVNCEVIDNEAMYVDLLDNLSTARSPNNLITNLVVDKEAINNSDSLSKTNITLSKPFLLLAGISGTGKTRFVREQAKATGAFSQTYCLTSVRPDWHEPSDLLGYISRLNGTAEYITTDVLQFIAKAWRAMVDAGLSIEIQDLPEHGERLVVNGERNELNAILPYWLCLDEMNLAPVEQYFADYLSVLETREWHWCDDSFSYHCDALLKSATIKEVADKEKLRKDLGFEASIYDDLWSLICQYGLSIPFNLMVAGTVNMDETTHGFSRKVIDRALSFDFGEFFPNDYNQFFSPENKDKTLSFPVYSHAKQEHLVNTVDSGGQRSIDFLSAVNQVLANTPFQLAYRALNELLLAIISANPQDEPTLKAVWDDFLMCKVLPRIEGDVDKLGSDPSLLEQLEKVLAEDQLSDIWHQEKESATARPDLFREKKEGADDSAKVIRIGCRSKAKITWMQTRLSNASFTSFWP